MDIGNKPVKKEQVVGGAQHGRRGEALHAQSTGKTEIEATVHPVPSEDENAPESAKHKGLRDYLDDATEAVKKNLSVAASVAALAFGGLTLLLYAWSIGQLPDFTWNDLTGTLFAVCVTGVLVVALIVAYCLSAGYVARSALEAVYEEAAQDVPAKQTEVGELDQPYGRLIRGPFILGATCFSVLAWVGLLTALSSGRLVSPYHEQLLGALITALFAIVVLVLIDWRRFQRPWQSIRYALLSLLIGTIAMVVVIITAWSVGPDSLVQKDLAKTSSAATVNWSAYWVMALQHVIAIGVSVAVSVAVLFSLGPILSAAGRVVSWALRFVRWRWLDCLVRALTRTSRVVVGDAADRRLMRAKVYVTFWFWLLASAVLLVADTMAAMGNAGDWSRNFGFIAALLTVLNWASFSVRQWRQRAALGLVTAALVFLSYPVLARNPFMFPKIVVSVLGLGHEHFASIGLSSKQCATLATYDVRCIADNERAFTLVNVNLLSRIGSSMVLELLIDDEGTESQGAHAEAAAPTAMQSSEGKALRPEKTLMATRQMGPKSSAAQACDKLLVSQLEPNDAIKAPALRCVVLVIPKDQVFGYTKAGARTYRGGYTAYEPPSAKAPAVVKVVADQTDMQRRGAAASTIQIAR